MTKALIKIEDSRLVTVGMFKTLIKQEGLVTVQELRRLEDRMDEKFVTNEKFERNMTAIADSFNQVFEAIHNLQKTMELILKQMAVINEEGREFRQQREQLYRTDTIHERKIDELGGRVLTLETAA